MTSFLPRTCSTTELCGQILRPEYLSSLPQPIAAKTTTAQLLTAAISHWWREQDSNLRSPKASDLQSDGFNRSPIPPKKAVRKFSTEAGPRLRPDHAVEGKWSPRRDSNPQPADYKSAALPIALLGHYGIRPIKKGRPFGQSKDDYTYVRETPSTEPLPNRTPYFKTPQHKPNPSQFMKAGFPDSSQKPKLSIKFSHRFDSRIRHGPNNSP